MMSNELNGKTMVCVTVQKTCERLIREGAKFAGEDGLRVVHVVKSGGSVLGGTSESEALEYLFQISRTYGAEMDMLRSGDVIGTLVDFAQKNGIEHLIIGSAAARSEMDMGSVLRQQLPDVQVHVIS